MYFDLEGIRILNLNEYQHGVYCKCGIKILFTNEDLTPPVTCVTCPKCKNVITYISRWTSDYDID